jgi:hypothetical protein
MVDDAMRGDIPRGSLSSTVPTIDHWAREILVGQSRQVILELAIRRQQRCAGVIPTRGSQLAWIGPVALRRCAGRLAGQPATDLSDPASDMDYELPDCVGSVSDPRRRLLGRCALQERSYAVGMPRVSFQDLRRQFRDSVRL